MSSPNPHPRLVHTAAAGLTMLAASRPTLFALGRPTLTPTGIAEQQQLELQDYTFAHDDILGTSLDLIVSAARPGDAVQCQGAVLAEIERLRAILSTYDPVSEISRVSFGLQPATAPELRQLLAAYDDWSARTGGAVDARLNQVVRLWREAARTGRVPAEAELRAALMVPGALNVDALGKARIIDQAVAIARRLVPAGLVNIGGDLRAWGDRVWQIGVADPLSPAENAPLLATFPLRDAAVATSGDYARPLLIAGRSYSHLIDPRSLQPVADLRSATVVAADCVTANALAAALSVLGPPGAASLADLDRAFGHLLVDRAGGLTRGGIFATAAPLPDASSPPSSASPPALSSASEATPGAPGVAAAWPKDFQATVNLAIGVGSSTAGRAAGPSVPGGNGVPGGIGIPGGSGVPFGGRGGRGGTRAYVAIWVEDARHKLVRTISVLGSKPKYIGELTAWAQAAGRPGPQTSSITRASRPNGLYSVVWDGLDDHGKPMPQGTYTIKVELNREHGRHATVSATLVCDDKPHIADLAASVESDASTISYGPKPKPTP
jgi:thiamine biosynthesis lipoprotein